MRSDAENAPAKSRPVLKTCLCFIVFLSITLYLIPNMDQTSSTSIDSETEILQLEQSSNDQDQAEFSGRQTARNGQYLSDFSHEISKKNLMFIKTHKCGTSTLVDVFYLFGVRRKLNFVMFPSSHQLELLNVEFKYVRMHQIFNKHQFCFTLDMLLDYSTFFSTIFKQNFLPFLSRLLP